MNWYILTIIPVLGLLVFVHELGHFITGKMGRYSGRGVWDGLSAVSGGYP